MASSKQNSVFSSFVEKGYRVRVRIVSARRHHVFKIRISRKIDGRTWSQTHVLDLQHSPAGGVDTSDLLALEEKTEEILQRLQ